MAAQLRAMNGRIGTGTVLVDGAGDQFLAGAGLTGDQHGDVLAGDAADRLVNLPHRRAPAEDCALHIRVRRSFGDDGRRAHPPADLEGVSHHSPHLREIEGLKEVIEGALFHGLDGGIGGLGERDEDDGDAGVYFTDSVIDLEAGLIGQAHVEKDDVGGMGPNALEACGSVAATSTRLAGAGNARLTCSGIRSGSSSISNK